MTQRQCVSGQSACHVRIANDFLMRLQMFHSTELIANGLLYELVHDFEQAAGLEYNLEELIVQGTIACRGFGTGAGTTHL